MQPFHEDGLRDPEILCQSVQPALPLPMGVKRLDWHETSSYLLPDFLLHRRRFVTCVPQLKMHEIVRQRTPHPVGRPATPAPCVGR